MVKTPPHCEVELQPLDHYFKLPTLGVRPVDVELASPPEPIKELESLAQQVAPACPLHPLSNLILGKLSKGL